MGIYIDLYRLDFNQYFDSLNKKFPQINDKDLLRKVMSEFGTFITENDFVILHNEYYEDGICTWNMDRTIEIAFKLGKNARYTVQNSFFDARKELVSYKECLEACEHLGLDRAEVEDSY